ncbi:glutamate-1-semialdehyde 2,1-aminomutase [bacterium]|nr:glutamate-1-semialdehyde 2,1-aminomutase [bacterium]MBU1752985.1 glutamate-1-semialdehyde 2,1-aminomutase [bacterium]
MNIQASRILFEKAKKYIPGGVNSPVRAFKAVGGTPRFIERGHGSKIFDVDRNSYIDYICSWGAIILGHAETCVISAVKDTLSNGTSFGAATALEVELAETIVDAVPGIEQVRLVSSGTEAVMSAIRLARGYTNRNRIIKFEGCYHGHADSMLIKAGSGAATLGMPDSLGIPADIAKYTTVVPYNDIEAVKQVMDTDVAAIIVEPVCGNMGVVLPQKGFLEGLREITTQYNSLLIFDEVITGFRLSYGGAQQIYGVIPDITCLGKIIGGGFPIGAYGGKREIMEYISPLGGVYQAGTLSGNPVAVQAGLVTLKILSAIGVYDFLDGHAVKLVNGIQEAANKASVAITINRIGSMFSVFFTNTAVTNYSTAEQSDSQKYASFFNSMLNNNIYLPPSRLEAWFIGLAHTLENIEQTISAAEEAFKKL